MESSEEIHIPGGSTKSNNALKSESTLHMQSENIPTNDVAFEAHRMSTQAKNEVVKKFVSENSNLKVPQINGPRYDSFLQPLIPMITNENTLEAMIPVNHNSTIAKHLPSPSAFSTE